MLILTPLAFWLGIRHWKHKQAQAHAAAQAALAPAPAQTPLPAPTHSPEPEEEPSVGLIPFDATTCVMMGNSLVDTQTGEVLAKGWLERFPAKEQMILMWDEERQRVVTRISGGFTLYDASGKRTGALGLKRSKSGSMVVGDDQETVFYSENGDIWKARID